MQVCWDEESEDQRAVRGLKARAQLLPECAERPCACAHSRSRLRKKRRSRDERTRTHRDDALKPRIDQAAPRRVCSPECPTPTSPPLSAAYYPRSGHIVAAVRASLGQPANPADLAVPDGVELDKPNPAFTGPF